jgi:hypothetical protein
VRPASTVGRVDVANTSGFAQHRSSQVEYAVHWDHGFRIAVRIQRMNRPGHRLGIIRCALTFPSHFANSGLQGVWSVGEVLIVAGGLELL